MVRLKDYIATSWVLGNMFQFQYGTIKSSDNQLVHDNTTMFQFQYGTIKSSPPIYIKGG